MAVARLCLDEKCSVETALDEMRVAGTDPRYVGLFAAPKNLRRPTRAELDAMPGDFPEVVEVGGFTSLMVQLDERWERLGLARAADWKQQYCDIAGRADQPRRGCGRSGWRRQPPRSRRSRMMRR